MPTLPQEARVVQPTVGPKVPRLRCSLAARTNVLVRDERV